MLNSRELSIAIALGTVLQVAMVVAGHSNPSIASLFAVGGMGLSLLAGLVYSLLARGTGTGFGPYAAGGAIAGGVCAFIGILVSHLLGDVPASLLALGTVSSIVTGAIGGAIGKFASRGAATAALLLCCSAAALPTANAQSIATSGAGARIAATTRDFGWLIGRWEGTVASVSGTADVTFAPPVAGLMTGVMRLSSEGKILVVELISLLDTPNGVELRFRHFSPSLDAYEQTFKQALVLTSHGEDRDVFENSVPYDKALMSTQPRVATYRRVDADHFVGHSDIIGSDGKPAVVEVTYRRLAAP